MILTPKKYPTGNNDEPSTDNYSRQQNIHYESMIKFRGCLVGLGWMGKKTHPPFGSRMIK